MSQGNNGVEKRHTVADLIYLIRVGGIRRVTNRPREAQDMEMSLQRKGSDGTVEDRGRSNNMSEHWGHLSKVAKGEKRLAAKGEFVSHDLS
jgi:hypothetical protein